MDRVGSSVCFGWLLLFEVSFFFGAVWVVGIGLVDVGFGCVGYDGVSVDSGVMWNSDVEGLVLLDYGGIKDLDRYV